MENMSESANVQKPKQADKPRKVSQNPRNNSTNWYTPKSKKLGVGFQFTPKACFVCGSFNHLIKDCDFHDKKMVQKPVLNNVKKGTGQREVRPVWNNAMRTNHQNFSNSRRNFSPTAVFTKSCLVPISAARQVLQEQQQQLVNFVKTAKGKRVTSAVGEQGIDVVKSKACWVWRLNLSTKVSTARVLFVKQKLFSNMKIGFSRVHVPLFDTMLLHDQPGQGEGPTVSVESQHTPTTSSSSTSQPTTSQPTSSQATSSKVTSLQAPSSHEPTTEPITTTSSPHP
ncbi:hypothetical protein Tco_1131095 [Tanacetum coccineum]